MKLSERSWTTAPTDDSDVNHDLKPQIDASIVLHQSAVKTKTNQLIYESNLDEIKSTKEEAIDEQESFESVLHSKLQRLDQLADKEIKQIEKEQKSLTREFNQQQKQIENYILIKNEWNQIMTLFSNKLENKGNSVLKETDLNKTINCLNKLNGINCQLIESRGKGSHKILKINDKTITIAKSTKNCHFCQSITNAVVPIVQNMRETQIVSTTSITNSNISAQTIIPMSKKVLEKEKEKIKIEKEKIKKDLALSNQIENIQKDCNESKQEYTNQLDLIHNEIDNLIKQYQIDSEKTKILLEKERKKFNNKMSTYCNEAKKLVLFCIRIMKLRRQRQDFQKKLYLFDRFRQKNMQNYQLYQAIANNPNLINDKQYRRRTKYGFDLFEELNSRFATVCQKTTIELFFSQLTHFRFDQFCKVRGFKFSVSFIEHADCPYVDYLDKYEKKIKEWIGNKLKMNNEKDNKGDNKGDNNNNNNNDNNMNKGNKGSTKNNSKHKKNSKKNKNKNNQKHNKNKGKNNKTKNKSKIIINNPGCDYSELKNYSINFIYSGFLNWAMSSGVFVEMSALRLFGLPVSLHNILILRNLCSRFGKTMATQFFQKEMLDVAVIIKCLVQCKLFEKVFRNNFDTKVELFSLSELRGYDALSNGEFEMFYNHCCYETVWNFCPKYIESVSWKSIYNKIDRYIESDIFNEVLPQFECISKIILCGNDQDLQEVLLECIPPN